MKNIWDGVETIFTDFRSNPTSPTGLQLACAKGNCQPAVVVDTGDPTQKINNFSKFGIGQSSGSTFGTENGEGSDTSSLFLPAPRAGGGKKRKNKKNYLFKGNRQN